MKLPIISTQELCRFLEKIGFINIRQKGSHRFYRHPDGRKTVVPIHRNKTIGKGLLLAILKQIKIEKHDFLKMYK